MRSFVLAAVTALAPLAALAAPPAAPKASEAKKISDKDLLYLVGTSVGHGLSSLHLSRAELREVEKGLEDQLFAKPRVDIEKVGAEAFGQRITALQAERSEKFNKDFLAKAAKAKGTKTLDKGVLYTAVKEGSGKQPTATDRVKVNYRGTLTDGSEFDSSYKRNEPATFPLNQVIPCWTEGVAQMKVGGKAKLVCPPDTAYGKDQRPGIPPNSTLLFDVELLEVLPPAPTPAPPKPQPGK